MITVSDPPRAHRTGRTPARRRPTIATVLGAGLAGALLTSALLTVAGPARAQDAEDAITRYVLDLELTADGTAHATLDLDIDFGDSPNHGPYLTYVGRQQFDDEDRDRVYRFSDITVESPTGAPTDLQVEERDGLLELRIGDPDVGLLTGVHSYHLTFTVAGWVNSAEAMDLPEDQLYLNVLSRWAIPVHDITVRVHGPAEVTEATCFTNGISAGEGCDAHTVGGGSAELAHAEFTQAMVRAHGTMTIGVGFPAGTFGGVEPIVVEGWRVDRAFSAAPVPLGTALLVLAPGALLVAGRARRTGRDKQYLGLTPGLAPGDAGATRVGRRRSGPVGLRFAPPDDVRPGQVGTLLDERAASRDVTASLIDLAVRGYLRIEVVTPSAATGTARDWQLVRLPAKSSRDLLPFERMLLHEVFHGRESTTLTRLRSRFAASVAKVRAALYDDVTTRGWFAANPQKVRRSWRVRGLAVAGVGVAATVPLAIWTSFGLTGLAVVGVGVLIMVLAGSAPARTADGTAALAQTEGFRLYLATAEADQIRFEEGEDLFSRYLPYAVAFGLADRWAKVFADVAAHGRAIPAPPWYSDPTLGQITPWTFGSSLTHDLVSFTRAAGDAISAPTPGSSGTGGSADFSSGGSSGGGVSGGGGGSW